jgi:tetratricopeptide (TPR) repeat protein
MKRAPRLIAVLLFTFLFAIPFTCLPQQSPADSLMKILFAGKNDTSKINTMSLITQWLKGRNKEASVLLLNDLRKALEKNTSLDETWKQIATARSWHIEGFITTQEGDYANSLATLSAALKGWEALEKNGSPEMKLILEGKAATLGTIAMIYTQQSDYSKALEYFFAGLRINETQGNKSAMAKKLGNIGVLYRYQGNFEKALEYYNRALKMDEEAGSRIGISTNLGNIAGVYMALQDFPKALETFNRALKIDEELENADGVARHLGNIAQTYEQMGDFTKALDYYLRSYKILEESGNKNGLLNQLSNMGGLYLKTKKYDQAETAMKKALTLAREVGSKESVRGNYLNLSMLDSCRGNFKNAYEYYKLSVLINDSILNEENTALQTRHEMQYEFDKKEAETKAAQEKKDAVDGAEKRKQKIILWSVGIGFALVLTFALYVFKSYREKKKINVEISAQKEIIEMKQKEVLDSIYYARRIQRSLLTNEKYILRHLARLNIRKHAG